MKKKIMVVTIIGLFMLMLPLMANAVVVQSGMCGENCTWELDDAGNLTITGTGEMINENSYSLFPKEQVRKATVSNGITSIADYAFAGCENLISVTFPRSITSIGCHAFSGCHGLLRVIIPTNTTSIAVGAFYECTSLTSIELPASLNELGGSIFAGCTGLTSVIIDDGVPEISEKMFDGCNKLTSITIPGSVTVIGKEAFNNCTKLETVEFNPGLQEIGRRAFKKCNVSTYDVPNTVTTVYIDAFDYPPNNLTLIFPDSLTNIITTEGSIGSYIKVYYSGAIVTIKANCGTTAQWYAQHGQIMANNGTWQYYSIRFESLSHIETEVQIKAPTCSQTGLENIVCSACNAVLVQNQVIPVVDHEPVSDQNGYDPTCTETGLTDSYSCLYCGIEIIPQEIVPALGHDWGEASYEWSGDNAEIIATHTCLRDDHYTENETVATTSNITKEPTCTESGETTYYAAFTKEGFVNQEKTVADVSALGHDWGSAQYTWSSDNKRVTAVHYCNRNHAHLELETATTTSTTTATCEEEGDTTYTSNVFNNPLFEVQTKVIEGTPALGHDWGIPTYTWSNNNDMVIAVRICNRNHDHSQDEMVEVTVEITKPSTCLEMGETTYTSSEFNNEAFETQSKTLTNIPALGHALVHHEAKAPTCTTIGWVEYDTCSRCDYTTYVEKAALGHTEAIDTAVAATCAETGLTEGKHCSVCGEMLVAQEVVPALGHALVHHDAKAPTCTEIGWAEYDTCSRCDYTTYVEKAALGHDLVHHEAKAPTCTAIGWDAYDTCLRCDYTTYVEKDALGHDLVHHEAKAPTCTAIGWDAYDTCSRCDYTTYMEKAVLGHSLVHHAAQDPTCTAIGWDAYDTCSRCDFTTYVEKTALGHDLIHHEAKAPICTEIGWDAYDTCSRCDYTTYVEKAALGHDLVHHERVEATYSEDGNEEYWSCSICSLLFSDMDAENNIPNPIIIPATGIVARGTCGDNLTWKLDDQRTLIISGTGAMTDYSCDYNEIPNNPWRSQKISSVIIEEGVTRIGNHAFHDCWLTSVTLPKSLTHIGEHAFYGIGLIKQIHLGDISTWLSMDFQDEYSYPNTQTDGEPIQFFVGDSELTSITLPDNISVIRPYAFSCCGSLVNVTIPEGVESIGNGAFSSCNNLTTVLLPNSLTSIGNGAFSWLDNLTQISIPENVQTIGGAAFYHSNLVFLYIPKNVSNIGSGAFGGSYSLRNVVFEVEDEDKEIVIGNNIFNGCRPTIYCHMFTYPHAYFVSAGGYDVRIIEDIGDISTIRAINLPQDFSMECGTTLLLDYSIFPNDGAQIIWTSSDPSILSVADGFVTAINPGSAEVTATIGDVSESITIETYVLPSEIILDTTEAWLQASKENIQINVQTIPFNASSNISWESSDTSRAIVDALGYVTTIRPGDVTISATTDNGIVASCLLHLTYPVTSVTIEPNVSNIYVDSPVQLTVIVGTTHDSYVNKLISFSSSETEIATIDDEGIVAGLHPGTATITALAANGVYDTLEVTVLLCPGHEAVTDEAIPPTCMEEGRTEGSHCAICNKVLVAQEIIPALGHDWNNVEYKWAEDNTSITAIRICNNDDSHVETETVYVSVVIISPTAENRGSASYTSDQFSIEGFTAQIKSIEIPALKDMSVISLPAMLTVIEDEAFENLACEAIIIPNSVTSIGNYAFRNCKNLKYIKVPANIVIPSDAFDGCGNVVIDRTTE